MTVPSNGGTLLDEKYLQERTAPDPRDFFYLSLSDLALALEQCGTDQAADLLDFGAGGSPYRRFFPNAIYERADVSFSGDTELDHMIREDGTIDAPDQSFDIVLSTQVVEHVPDAKAYFDESFRLLRSGGRLICSTHGYFPDHGCPADFRRWTADGLKHDLENAGFEVIKMLKLTAGSRAFFSVLDFTNSSLDLPATSPFGVALLTFRKLFSLMRPGFYKVLDKHRPHERIVALPDDSHNYYIGLLAEARKR